MFSWSIILLLPIAWELVRNNWLSPQIVDKPPVSVSTADITICLITVGGAKLTVFVVIDIIQWSMCPGGKGQFQHCALCMLKVDHVYDAWLTFVHFDQLRVLPNLVTKWNNRSMNKHMFHNILCNIEVTINMWVPYKIVEYVWHNMEVHTLLESLISHHWYLFFFLRGLFNAYRHIKTLWFTWLIIKTGSIKMLFLFVKQKINLEQYIWCNLYHLFLPGYIHSCLDSEW